MSGGLEFAQVMKLHTKHVDDEVGFYEIRMR